jgi:Ca2+-binding RTX toxin-like protein
MLHHNGRHTGSVSRPTAFVELLEARRLLSATLNSAGTLNILGTSKDDVISVYRPHNDPSRIEAKVRNVVSSFNLADVKQIRIEGFSGHDYIQVSNNIALPTRIYGGAGNDTIIGGGSRDRIYGGTGNDSIIGNSGHDILYGEEGDDTIRGGNGNDYIVGGEGNDFLEGNAGNDRLYGGPGNDIIHGNAGHDLIYGGAGSDTLHGGAGNDSICGGDDDDFILGGDGHDYLYGGEGNDFILGGNGDDDISGGPGNDTIDGQGGNDDFYDADERAQFEFADDLGPNLLPDFAFACDPTLER